MFSTILAQRLRKKFKWTEKCENGSEADSVCREQGDCTFCTRPCNFSSSKEYYKLRRGTTTDSICGHRSSSCPPIHLQRRFLLPTFFEMKICSKYLLITLRIFVADENEVLGFSNIPYSKYRKRCFGNTITWEIENSAITADKPEYAWTRIELTIAHCDRWRQAVDCTEAKSRQEHDQYKHIQRFSYIQQLLNYVL